VPLPIHGRHVVLRPFQREELDQLVRGRAADRPGSRRRLAELIEHSGRLWRGRIELAVEADGRLVGDVQARQPEHCLPPGVYEIGISLFAESDRGKGYGRDAVELLTTHLFAERAAERVQASTAVHNAPMRAVLAGLGFREEGVMRAFMPGGAGVRDDYALYAVTRDEWRPRRR
jgi:RimJ/RimL family protein N-acetyltransferase